MTEVAKAIGSGMLDIGSWTPYATPNAFPYNAAFAIPFLGKPSALDSAQVIEDVKAQFPEVREELNRPGKELFTWAPATYALCGVNNAVKTLDDLKGKRCLIFSPAESALLEALGAVPVFVTAGDAYIGLQRGMGEFLFCALPYMKSLKVYEVAHNLTVFPSIMSSMTTTINNDALADLTPEQQKILFDSVADLTEKLETNLNNDAQASIAEFKKSGGEVVTLEGASLEPFAEKGRAILESYWYPILEKYGMKDPKSVCAKYYEISATSAGWKK